MRSKYIIVLAVFAIVALSAMAQQNLPKTTIGGVEYYYYVPSAGESIYDIAAKLSVTKDEIIKNNPDAADGIESGMRLYFPVEKSAPAPVATSQTHKVEQGETLYGLAKRYGLTVEALVAATPSAENGIKVGQVIASGHGVAPEVGNALPLSEIPVGTLVHNIELRPGQGAAMARSAGTFAQLAAREGKYAVLRLPSGETRMVSVACRATVGTVSNPDHNLESYGKAGRSRWLGRRPHNRGVVMNPVDHPMGGGEGRASGGHPRSRKGLPAKGYKTRNPKAASNKFIIERRKK